MEFENEINKILQKYGPISREHEIRKKWPEITKIDHALIRGGLWCFQTKWQKRSTSSPEIETIIAHSMKLSKKLSLPLMCVVLVSKIQCARLAFEPAARFINICCNYEHNIEKLLTGTSMALYDHQNEVVKIFNKGGSFIVKHPTGTGKTISILACIKEHRKLSAGTILWITKHVDVINSQRNTIGRDIVVCPQNFAWSGPATYLTNTDQLMTYFKHSSQSGRVDVGQLLANTDLLIIDEVHGSAAEKCFEIFKQFGCRKIGFSATPFGPNIERNAKLSQLFPAGILHELSFFRAVEMGLIVSPTIHLSTSTDIVFDLINESATGFCICWANTCESAEKWIPLFKNYKIYRNFGKYSEMPVSELNTGIHVMFCVGRCKEGFDMPIIDTVINLDCESFEYNSFIQKMGRCVRNYRAGDFVKTKCVYFQKFADKFSFMANILKGILGEIKYSPMEYIRSKKFHLLYFSEIKFIVDSFEFEELKKYIYYSIEVIVNMKFKSINEYEINAEKNIRLPEFPEKLEGWPGWEIVLEANYYSKEEIVEIFKNSPKGKSRSVAYEEYRKKINDARVPELRAAVEIYKNLNFIKTRV